MLILCVVETPITEEKLRDKIIKKLEERDQYKLQNIDQYADESPMIISSNAQNK